MTIHLAPNAAPARQGAQPPARPSATPPRILQSARAPAQLSFYFKR